MQDSILRFSRPENLKNHVFAIFQKKGEGRAGQGLGSERLGAGQHRARAKARAKKRAGCRTGRAQAGCRGRAQRAGQGCKISILRFSSPENLKNHVFAIFQKKGAQAGCRGMQDFHFEVFKA